MSDALLIIDAQKYWTDNNPETTRRIDDHLQSLKGRLQTIWVYAQEAPTPDQKPAAQVGQRNLEAVSGYFNDTVKLMFDPVLQPAAKDWFIGKGHTDTFTNPHFKTFLQEQGIDRLYIAGFMTGYCVYDTAVSGQREGFDVTVLSDLVADKNDVNDIDGGDFEKAGIRTRPSTGLNGPR